MTATALITSTLSGGNGGEPARRSLRAMAEWWRDAVLYEIYVRSFADSDGDGVGDLAGIRSRLAYLRELGVDGIWLTPSTPPPAPTTATTWPTTPTSTRGSARSPTSTPSLPTRTSSVCACSSTSSRTTPRASMSGSGTRSPIRATRTATRYFFRPGRDGRPPNGWTSAFGGPAWTLDRSSGEYYLHFFAPEQPDLDWHNEDVQRYFEDDPSLLARPWRRRLSHRRRAGALQRPDAARDDPAEPRTWHADWVTALNQPEVHALYRRWRAVGDEYPGDRIFVGEIVLANQETIARYVRPGRAAPRVQLLAAPRRVGFRGAALDDRRDAHSADAVGAPASWVFENHDVARLRRATAAGRRDYAAPARPRCSCSRFRAPRSSTRGRSSGSRRSSCRTRLRQDPIFLRTGGERVGRDGCRVPIPWQDGPPGFGFTSGTPWLPLPDEWAALTVEGSGPTGLDTRSLPAALALRPGGGFAWREPDGALAFGATTSSASSTSTRRFELPAGELLLASEPGVRRVIQPATAAWVRAERGT